MEKVSYNTFPYVRSKRDVVVVARRLHGRKRKRKGQEGKLLIYMSTSFKTVGRGKVQRCLSSQNRVVEDFPGKKRGGK